MGQRQPGHNRIAEIGKARDDGIEPMRGEIGADASGCRTSSTQGVTVETEIFYKLLRRIQGHITQMDLVPAMLIEQAGNQRPDLAGTEDEHTIHHEALYSTLEFRPLALRNGVPPTDRVVSVDREYRRAYCRRLVGAPCI